MDFCEMCQSAGSVNAYGHCEICGSSLRAEENHVQTVEAPAAATEVLVPA